MKRLLLLAWFGLAVASAHASAQSNVRRVEVQFSVGASEANLAGTIKGHQFVDYTVRARSGQSLTVTFKPGNPSAYFNVLPPKSQAALFVGSVSGNRFEGTLPANGMYTIRVYLIRNAARRNETANYTLDVGIADTKAPTTGSGKTMELLGVWFGAASGDTGDMSILRIGP